MTFFLFITSHRTQNPRRERTVHESVQGWEQDLAEGVSRRVRYCVPQNLGQTVPGAAHGRSLKNNFESMFILQHNKGAQETYPEMLVPFLPLCTSSSEHFTKHIRRPSPMVANCIIALTWPAVETAASLCQCASSGITSSSSLRSVPTGCSPDREELQGSMPKCREQCQGSRVAWFQSYHPLITVRFGE